MDADQLDGVGSTSGHHGVPAAAHFERGDVAGAAERVKAAGAVGRRAGRLERAVFVDADQLDAVVAVRGYYGVPSAAHLERVDGAGYTECVEGDGVGSGRRDVASRRWRGAAGRRRRGAAGRQHCGAACRRAGGVAVGGRGDRLERAVLVDAGQLDGVARVPRGHHGVPAAAHLERVDGAGAAQRVKAAGAAVGRTGRLEGTVFVDADQLDGAGAVPRGHGGVRAAAHLERVDAVGAAQRVKAAGAAGRRAGRLEGAVLVDTK